MSLKRNNCIKLNVHNPIISNKIDMLASVFKDDGERGYPDHIATKIMQVFSVKIGSKYFFFFFLNIWRKNQNTCQQGLTSFI